MDLETLLKYSGMEKDISESKMSDLDIEAQDNSREDFVDMHKDTFGSAEEAGKFWDDSKEANESVETEAVGQFADPIYDLIDEMGNDDKAHANVLHDLIRYLDGDTIKDFVDEFRRVNDYGNGGMEAVEEVEAVEEATEEAEAVEEAEVEGQSKHEFIRALFKSYFGQPQWNELTGGRSGMRRLKIGTGGNMPDTNEFQKQLKAAGLSDDVRVKKAKDGSYITVLYPDDFRMQSITEAEVGESVNEDVSIGDHVKVKGQDIEGKVIADHGNMVVIRDEDAETDDDELEFRKSDLELAESVKEADVQEADVQETVEVAVDDLASLMSLAGLQADTQATEALDEYSNSPDEDYMDADMQLNKLSGGLNGPKAHTRKEGPGDNPLAAKLADQLQALMSK